MMCAPSFSGLLKIITAALLLSACSDGPAKESGPSGTDASAGLPSVPPGPAPTPDARIAPRGVPEPAAIPPAFTALGTEPFWSARVDGSTLLYSTPEDPAGAKVIVARTDRPGWAGFHATLDGKPLELEVTRARCSDGMSETAYPMAVVRRIGTDVQPGCAR